MLPVKLELKNFLSYCSPEPIRFEGVHLACLTGPNGAGKSSLLDAITWAIWGKARTDNQSLIHQGQTEMHVQLDFLQDGALYRVIRRLSTKSGGNTLDLFSVDVDGSLIALTEGGKRETQKKIEKLVRLTYDIFVASAFLQQGKADLFSAMDPAKRKALLVEILEIDRWLKYEEQVKEKEKEINQEITALDLRIKEIDSDLRREPDLRRMLDEAQAAAQTAEAQRAEAQARLDEVRHTDRDHREAEKRRDELMAQNKARKAQQAKLTADIAANQSLLNTLQATLDQADEIEQGYAAYQDARETDAVLGEKLGELQRLSERRSALQRQLDEAEAALKREISNEETRIAEARKVIARAKHDELDQLRAQAEALQGGETELPVQRALYSERTSELAALKQSLGTIEGEANKLKKRIERVDLELTQAACPLCGQPLSEHTRDRLLAELNGQVAEYRQAYKQNKERIALFEVEIKQIDTAIKDWEGKERTLNNLRSRISKLESDTDAARDAQAAIDAAQAKIADLQARLDAGLYGETPRAELKTIMEQIDALQYDKTLHDQTRQALNRYKAYQDRYMQLQGAREKFDGVQLALQSQQAHAAELATMLTQDDAALGALIRQIDALGAQVKEFQARFKAYTQINDAAQRAQERLAQARQEIASLETQRERREEYAGRLIEQRELKTLYDELKHAFGKKGVPVMIIQSVVPELEKDANELLRGMTDGRMTIRLETKADDTGKTDQLNIIIADELGTRPYDNFSGGEAFRINFALRVALSRLLARRAGAQLEVLFIDEGFGTQDEEGRSRLVEAIQSVQEYFALILVITHIDELRDQFPVQLVVEKRGGCSHVRLN